MLHSRHLSFKAENCLKIVKLPPRHVVLRLATAVWLQIWVDDGDGLEEMRRANDTWTSSFHTEEEFKGVINYNPNLEFYQLIYGLIIVAMLVFGFFKGAGILITMTRGSLKVASIMQNDTEFGCRCMNWS